MGKIVNIGIGSVEIFIALFSLYISKDVPSNNYFPKDLKCLFMILSAIKLYVQSRKKLLRRLNVRDDGSALLLDRWSKSREGSQNADPLFIKLD